MMQQSGGSDIHSKFTLHKRQAAKTTGTFPGSSEDQRAFSGERSRGRHVGHSPPASPHGAPETEAVAELGKRLMNEFPPKRYVIFRCDGLAHELLCASSSDIAHTRWISSKCQVKRRRIHEKLADYKKAGPLAQVTAPSRSRLETIQGALAGPKGRSVLAPSLRFRILVRSRASL